jgi:hypothetical protein
MILSQNSQNDTPTLLVLGLAHSYPRSCLPSLPRLWPDMAQLIIYNSVDLVNGKKAYDELSFFYWSSVGPLSGNWED